MQKLEELYPDDVEVVWDYNPFGVNAETGEIKYDGDEVPSMEDVDVVFTNNISNFGGGYTFKVIETAKNKGILTHWDTDDLLTNIYKGHRLKDVYQDSGLSELAKHCYAVCDLATVTQAKFANRISPFVKSGGGTLAIIKNMIDYNLPCWNEPKVPPYKKKFCRVGWAGGIHHEQDLAFMPGIMAAVNQKVGQENVFWSFFGKPPQQLKEDPKEAWQLDVWDNYERKLAAGRNKNYKTFGAMMPSQYGGMFAHMDLGLSLLEYNDFNDSKSEIKLAECGRYKIPLIATDVGCYAEIVKNWENGVLVPRENSRSHWIKVLTRVIKDKDLRERMGKNLYKITEAKFNINNHVHHRLDLYKTLLGIEDKVKIAGM